MSNLSDDLKKAFLFGVGAIAKTSEKSKKLIDELIERGALTVEQGKTLNEELKHNLQEKIIEKEKELNSDLISQIKDMKNLSDEDIKFCKLYDDPSIIIAYPDGNVIRSIMALYTTTLKKMPDLKCSEESTELKFFSKEELKEIKIVETHTPILADYFM